MTDSIVLVTSEIIVRTNSVALGQYRETPCTLTRVRWARCIIARWTFPSSVAHQIPRPLLSCFPPCPSGRMPRFSFHPALCWAETSGAGMLVLEEWRINTLGEHRSDLLAKSTSLVCALHPPLIPLSRPPVPAVPHHSDHGRILHHRIPRPGRGARRVRHLLRPRSSRYGRE